MKHYYLSTTALALSASLFTNSAISGTMGNITSTPAANYYKNLEISAAGGPNWFNTKDTTLQISPFETDSVLVNGVSNNGAWKVGIGYYLFEEQLAHRTYFNHFLFEANVYQVSGTVNGDVWQFELPQFNNYSYSAPCTSTRLMFDFKPSLFTWKRASIYPILGVGATWNTISYTETITGAGVPANSELILDDSTTTQVAGDVGAGIRVVLTDYLSATGEYVYGFLDNGSPAGNPANGVRLASAPNFSFQTQSLLFGLSLKL